MVRVKASPAVTPRVAPVALPEEDVKNTSPHRRKRRWGESATDVAVDYPRVARPLTLRSVLRARFPGAVTRISDTRVRNVPDATRRVIALSVANDVMDRPVQDRAIVTSHVGVWFVRMV